MMVLVNLLKIILTVMVNCIVDEDCFGECGGDAYVDECGDCVYPDDDCINRGK